MKMKSLKILIPIIFRVRKRAALLVITEESINLLVSLTKIIIHAWLFSVAKASHLTNRNFQILIYQNSAQTPSFRADKNKILL
jgi:hypothetical protein